MRLIGIAGLVLLAAATALEWVGHDLPGLAAWAVGAVAVIAWGRSLPADSGIYDR